MWHFIGGFYFYLLSFTAMILQSFYYRALLLLLLCGLWLCILSNISVAATRIMTEAVVNETIITNLDVDQRLKLAKLFSGLPDIPEVQQRLRNQMLQRLIAEALQQHILNEKNIKVSDEQITAAVNQFSTQQRLSSLKN